MHVIMNATGHFFGGYKPSGRSSLFEPIFKRPIRGEPIQMAVYDTQEDAQLACSELKRYGETVIVATLITNPTDES